jgi:N-acetylmuramoyl-L-alanine amidase
MRLIRTPSPNFGPRRGAGVDMLVLHYTGMCSAGEALARLCDPAAAVSAHYLVDEDGSVHALVDEAERAWHAGVGSWRGRGDVNSRSVGIELVNPGHEFGYRAFPTAQIDALMELGGGILARHPIPARNVVGHSDVAPARKEDPGELFPWPLLAEGGLGLWPFAGDEREAAPPAGQAAALLAGYGYDVGDLAKTVAAFQRHFRPDGIDGIMDAETAGRLMRLLAVVA